MDVITGYLNSCIMGLFIYFDHFNLLISVMKPIYAPSTYLESLLLQSCPTKYLVVFGCHKSQVAWFFNGMAFMLYLPYFLRYYQSIYACSVFNNKIEIFTQKFIQIIIINKCTVNLNLYLCFIAATIVFLSKQLISLMVNTTLKTETINLTTIQLEVFSMRHNVMSSVNNY